MRAFFVMAVMAAATLALAIRHFPVEAESDPARPGHAQEVRSIAFDGRSLPTAALRGLLSTRVGQRIDMAVLARDCVVLEDALVAHGFYAAHVGDAQVVFDADGAAFVTFPIMQGPQFRVRSVTVTGAAIEDTGIVTLTQGEVILAARVERVRAGARRAARGACGQAYRRGCDRASGPRGGRRRRRARCALIAELASSRRPDARRPRGEIFAVVQGLRGCGRSSRDFKRVARFDEAQVLQLR